MIPKGRRKFRQAITNAGALCLLFPLIFHVINFAFVSAMPSSYWFDYQWIIPEKDRYKVGESVYFVSSMNINHRSNLEWEDILYCNLLEDDDDSHKYFSVYHTKGQGVTPKKTEEDLKKKPDPWRYQAPVPYEPANCYLHSTTTIELELGQKKHQTMISPEFEIRR